MSDLGKVRLLLFVVLVVAAWASARANTYDWNPTVSGTLLNNTGGTGNGAGSLSLANSLFVVFHNNGTAAWVNPTVTVALSSTAMPGDFSGKFQIQSPGNVTFTGTVAVNSQATGTGSFPALTTHINSNGVACSPYSGGSTFTIQPLTGADVPITLGCNPSGTIYTYVSGVTSAGSASPSSTTVHVYYRNPGNTRAGTVGTGTFALSTPITGAVSSIIGVYRNNEDGTYTKLLSLNGDGNGNVLATIPSDLYGQHLTLFLDQYTMSDGVKVAAHIFIKDYPAVSSSTDGSATGNTTVSGQPAISSSTVDGSGNVSTDSVGVTSVTTNGTSSVTYSYPNADGGVTSINYQGSGTGSVTQSDVRQQTSQNSAENNAIEGAINKNTDTLGAKLDDINSTLQDIASSGSSSPTPSPTPGASATPTPSPTPGLHDPGDPYVTGTSAANYFSGFWSGSAVSDDGQGLTPSSAVAPSQDSSFWIVNLGPFGTMNLNPMSDPRIASLALFIRNLLILIVTAFVVFYVYRLAFDVEVAWMGATPGANFGFVLAMDKYSAMFAEAFATFLGDIAAQAAVVETLGISEIFGMVITGFVFIKNFMKVVGLVVMGLLPKLILTAVFALLPIYPTLFSAYISFDTTTVGAPVGKFVFGGQSIFSSIQAYLFGATGFIGEAVALLNQFVPLGHVITAFGNCWMGRVLMVFFLKALNGVWKTVPR